MAKTDRFFSGSAVTRLPLYKLIAGGLAVTLFASLGIGVMAAGLAGGEPAAPTPTPLVTAAPDGPRPTATPARPPRRKLRPRRPHTRSPVWPWRSPWSSRTSAYSCMP